jgi:hypothetical protein
LVAVLVVVLVTVVVVGPVGTCISSLFIFLLEQRPLWWVLEVTALMAMSAQAMPVTAETMVLPHH